MENDGYMEPYEAQKMMAGKGEGSAPGLLCTSGPRGANLVAVKLGPPDRADAGSCCGGAQPLRRWVFGGLAVRGGFAGASALTEATQARRAPQGFSPPGAAGWAEPGLMLAVSGMKRRRMWELFN